MTYVVFFLTELAVFILPKLTVFRKHGNRNLQSLPPIDHQLKQSEIDELVNHLLSNGNRSFPIR